MYGDFSMVKMLGGEINIMELEENKIYSNAELAKWFGIQTASFAKTKKKKLEYLKQFAEFEEIKGKVKIVKVIEPVYVNPRDKKNNDLLYQEDIEEVISHYPYQMFKTCTGRVQLLSDGKTKKLNHRFSTAYKYVRENLRVIANGDEHYWCERHFNSKIDFTVMPEDQLAYWNELIQQYICSDTEKANYIAEIKSQEENGELSKEEAQEYIYHASSACWEMAKAKFAERYNFIPCSVPKWQLTAWQNEKE